VDGDDSDDDDDDDNDNDNNNNNNTADKKINFFSQSTSTLTDTRVPGGKDLTSGECSLGQTIPI